MKTIILIRHAMAENNPHINDHQRQLTLQGTKDAIKIAKYLAQNNYQPDYALISDATRTKQTWQYLAQNLIRQNEINCQFMAELYNATMGDMIKIINLVPDQFANLIIIGHNPVIAQLALFFTANISDNNNSFLRNYPAAGLTILHFSTISWKEIDSNLPIKAEFVDPAKLC